MARKIARKIPAIMASQHPDNAGQPYWHYSSFVPATFEPQECFRVFSDLEVPEYKWDWEGKIIDENLLEKLIGENFEFFQQHKLGKDVFLTMRLPNPDVESGFRLDRIFLNLIAAAALAKRVNLHTPPIFEAILPMTENEHQIIKMQTAFAEVAGLKHQLIDGQNSALARLSVIPLFEQVEVILESDQILKRYLKLHQKTFGSTPAYLRPYIARSDPALNSGLVPTVLAVKIALSRYRRLEKETGVKLFPIVGCASIPFRGHLAPATVKQFIKNYAGVQTVLIQSAFRYDYPKKDVIRAIRDLKKNLPRSRAVLIPARDEADLKKTIKIFQKHYRQTVEKLASFINAAALNVPKRRERVQHLGLFGYSRGVHGVKLPRPIKFTAALYSIGLPPEIIGTGRALAEIKNTRLFKTLLKYYPHLKFDLAAALPFVNQKNLKKLIPTNSAFTAIQEDLEAIEKILGLTIGPQDVVSKNHLEKTSQILKLMHQGRNPQELINQAAGIRKALG